MTNQDNPQVEELLKAGSYLKAAELAESMGEFLRSAEIYAKTWNFEKAVKTALKGNDLSKALTWAVESKNEALMDHCDLLLDIDTEPFQKALALYKTKRLDHRVAKLKEATREFSEASHLYAKSKRWLAAAKASLKEDDFTKAEMYFEKQIEKTTNQSLLSESEFLLGSLLGHQGRTEDAIKHLQRATHVSTWRLDALKLLIKMYHRLGLDTAARETLLHVREIDSTCPSALDAFLAMPFKKSDLFSIRQHEKIAGRYTLQSLIGYGGSGQVHLAVDEQTKRKVALKLLTDATNQDNPLYARFVRESEIAKSLQHKNIVSVHDVSAERGYIAMEFMSGGSLDKRIDDKALTALRTKAIALDMISALNVAHAQGVIHRDIKPANIFLEAGGTAKLGDFGVAHLLDLGQTQTGGLIGTLAYMSPEQMTGAPIGPEADQYSLAITLFQCLAGRLPFKGPDFISEHLSQPPPLLSDLNPELKDWDQVISKALAKSPAERFKSLSLFKEAINSISVANTHKPMMMPKPSSIAPTAPSTTSSESLVTKNTEESQSRHVVLDSKQNLSYATIARGLDTILARSVQIETWHQPLSHDETRRLKFFAKGNPYLQKVLSFDESNRTVVYEALVGTSLDTLQSPLKRVQLFKILKLVTQVYVAFEGETHFGLDLTPKDVVVDLRGIPTLLLCGNRLFASSEKPPLDVLKGLAGLLLGCPCNWNDISKQAPRSPNSKIESVRDAFRLFETLQHATVAE